MQFSGPSITSSSSSGPQKILDQEEEERVSRPPTFCWLPWLVVFLCPWFSGRVGMKQPSLVPVPHPILT